MNWPHEYAQEEPAKEAIVGADSPLWVKKDAEGNPITPFIELVMGEYLKIYSNPLPDMAQVSDLGAPFRSSLSRMTLYTTSCRA